MYAIDKHLEGIAEWIILDRPEFNHLSDVRIVYMTCDEPKRNGKKTVLADCEKLSEKMSTLSGVDFVITFYADSEELPDDKILIVMEHELMHVGWDGERKTINPHDVEDFHDILSKYGLDWKEP